VSELDLLYTDVEDDLRSSVRDLLADRCDPAAVTAVYDGDRSLVPGLWNTLAADLGLAGLLVPEDRGGAGASAREAAVVLEELGRAAAPVPFLTSAVVATTVLLDAPGDRLESLAAGERTAALAVPLSTAPHGALPSVAVDADGRLTGTVTSVAGALEADVLLVPAATPDGLAVYAVPIAAAVTTPVISLDMTRQLADLTLDAVGGEPVLADAEPAVRRALETGAALLASEQLGVAQWCLDTTVAYLKQRRQFGRVVGGFQALKHRLADLYTGVESARAAARYAAAALAAGDPDVPVASAVAQAFCSDLAVTAAEEAIQLHGGIGMTWEHPAHLYLKRAKADQIAFGTPGAHRARLAGLVDLPAPREGVNSNPESPLVHRRPPVADLGPTGKILKRELRG
jgi:alkylation response protein AidB-like acyl-CoA dehydrogenase